MIPHELEDDFPYYQSITKKINYEMVKDMGLAKVSLTIHKKHSIWFWETTPEESLKNYYYILST